MHDLEIVICGNLPMSAQEEELIHDFGGEIEILGSRYIEDGRSYESLNDKTTIKFRRMISAQNNG